MEAKEFIKKISALKPTKEELVGLSCPDGLVENRLKGFDARQLTDELYDSPIISLMNNYDMSSLNIHDITLDNGIQEDDEYIFFGWDATANRIAIQKWSGKIISYDEYGNLVACECADNSATFLDALYEIMKFAKEKLLMNFSEEEMDKRSAEIAPIAALSAGGLEYLGYYKAILGVED